MKRFLISAALMLATVASFACTNLIVGKKASADGSVMCTYNCDGFGFASPLSYYAPGRHAPGELIALRGEGRYVAQADYTYGVVGLMNENQVTIVETTWDGREELRNREGWLDYFTLMRLTLQRATSAREAIAIMDALIKEYGYNSTGESFAICDPEEAWIMELIGKGPGRKGGVWVALRVPDDCICAYANSSRIRQFPQARRVDKKLGFKKKRNFRDFPKLSPVKYPSRLKLDLAERLFESEKGHLAQFPGGEIRWTEDGTNGLSITETDLRIRKAEIQCVHEAMNGREVANDAGTVWILNEDLAFGYGKGLKPKAKEEVSYVFVARRMLNGLPAGSFILLAHIPSQIVVDSLIGAFRGDETAIENIHVLKSKGMITFVTE